MARFLKGSRLPRRDSRRETDRERFKLALSRIRFTSKTRGEARYRGRGVLVSLAASGWVTISGSGHRVHPKVLQRF